MKCSFMERIMFEKQEMDGCGGLFWWQRCSVGQFSRLPVAYGQLRIHASVSLSFISAQESICIVPVPFYWKYFVWHCATCPEEQCQRFHDIHYNKILFLQIFSTILKKWTKKSHFLSTAGARPTIPTILGMVIEEVRPIFALPLTLFDPITSFAAKGYWKFVGKFPHRVKMLITWLFVPQSDQIKNLKANYRRVEMLRIL